MIHEIFDKHDNFRGPTAYVLRPDRGYLLDCSIGPQARIDEIVEEFTSYRILNRRVQKPVFHAAINLAPGESLSDEQWRFAARTYLQALGFNDSAYLVVKHTNKPHEHIHIVASRIGASGRCVSDSNDYAKGERIMRALEKRFSLSRVAPSLDSLSRALSGDEINAALSSNTPNLRFELQQEVAQAAHNATVRTMVEQLHLRGVAVHLHAGGPDGKPVGISFEVEGLHFAGGSLGRAFTWTGLQRHYGLSVTPEDAPCIAERLTQAASHAPSGRAFVRQSIDLALTQRPANLKELVAELDRSEVSVRFHLTPAGEPRGISYQHKNQTWTGSEIGKHYTLGGLGRRGVQFDRSTDASLVAQLATQRATTSARTTERPDLSTWKGPTAEDTWSSGALRELRTRLARLRPPKGSGRRELSAALYQLRRAPAVAIRTAAHAQYLLSALTSPQRAARLLLGLSPAGKPIADLLAFAGAFRSPRAAVLFALRLGYSKLHAPPPDPLAPKLIDAYVKAALVDGPRSAIARLAEAGIRTELRAGRLVLTLADQTLAAHTLGNAHQELKTAYAHFSHSRAGINPRPGPGPRLLDRASRTDAPELRPLDRSRTRRAEPIDSSARNPSPSPQQAPSDAASPAPLVDAVAAQPHRAAPPPAHSDDRSPRVAPSYGDPGSRHDRRPMPGAVLRDPGRGVGALAEGFPDECFTRAVELHLQALQGSTDLRILRVHHPPETFHQISQDDVRALIPKLNDLHREGAHLLIRSREMHMLKGVPQAVLARSAKRGFEPAVAVATSPDLCDVWLRLPASNSTNLFLRRATSLEYGSRLGSSSSFGNLATSPGQVLAEGGQIFSRASEFQHLLSFQQSTHLDDLRKACDAAGVPSLNSFRGTHRLSSIEADRRWSQLALKAGLAPQLVFTSLLAEGGRRLDPRPEAAARYAARTLEKGLKAAHSLSGSALTNLVLRSVSSGLGIPLAVLRVGTLVVGTLLRRSRSR